MQAWHDGLTHCCVWGFTNGDSGILDFEANRTATYRIDSLLKVTRSPLRIPTNKAMHLSREVGRYCNGRSLVAAGDYGRYPTEMR